MTRPQEITDSYLKAIDKHLLDLVDGRTEKMFEIRDFAGILHIHPTHLTNTVKQTTGKHPCFFYEEKILDVAKKMIAEDKMSIASIATQLTYDPSNFAKWFKRFAGKTPKQYREEVLNENTELTTI